MKIDVIVLNRERYVTLTCYLQGTGEAFSNIEKRPAIIVLPGGGYQFCSEREADPVAAPYLAAGFHVFILRYSVNEYKIWPNPLDDYEQAMKMIREHAKEWGIYEDMIAVIGFSAGGHLAGAAATLSENKPNAAVLCYAVLNGTIAKECSPSAPDLISAVDSQTCPCFLYATRDDELVPVINSLKFAEALNEAGVNYEMHIYSYGEHGSSTVDPSTLNGTITPRAQTWVNDSIGWLGELFGKFTRGGMTEPVIGKYASSDYADTLSLDCTFGYLLTQEAAKPILAPLYEGMKKRASKAAGSQAGGEFGEPEGPGGMVSRMKLGTVLKYANLPEEELKRIDRALRQIPNNHA